MLFRLTGKHNWRGNSSGEVGASPTDSGFIAHHCYLWFNTPFHGIAMQSPRLVTPSSQNLNLVALLPVQVYKPWLQWIYKEKVEILLDSS